MEGLKNLILNKGSNRSSALQLLPAGIMHHLHKWHHSTWEISNLMLFEIDEENEFKGFESLPIFSYSILWKQVSSQKQVSSYCLSRNP